MDELSDEEKEDIVSWALSKHGDPHRKEMQDLELLPSLPLSSTFHYFPVLWWTGERANVTQRKKGMDKKADILSL